MLSYKPSDQVIEAAILREALDLDASAVESRISDWGKTHWQVLGGLTEFVGVFSLAGKPLGSSIVWFSTENSPTTEKAGVPLQTIFPQLKDF